MYLQNYNFIIQVLCLWNSRTIIIGFCFSSKGVDWSHQWLLGEMYSIYSKMFSQHFAKSKRQFLLRLYHKHSGTFYKIKWTFLTVVSITRFSQHLDASPFLNLTIHFPPCLFASSYNKQVNSTHNYDDNDNDFF